MTLSELFTNIANAIRGKDGTTDSIAASDFSSRIDAIKTGVDTSDATATASDMASGVTAYVNGEKIIGGIPVLSSGGELALNYNSLTQPNDNIIVNGKFNTDQLCRSGSSVNITVRSSVFGDATAADVAYGKTFTSAAGFLVTGTLESYNYNHVNFGDSDVSIGIDGQGHSQIRLSNSSITASSQIVAIDFGAEIAKRGKPTYMAKTKSATHSDYNASTTHTFYCEFSGESGSVVPIVENGALVLHLVDFGGFYNCLSDEGLLDAADWYYFDCQFVFTN